MPNIAQPRKPLRRWLTAVVGALLIAVGIAAIVSSGETVTAPVESPEPVEVCDATEYEGCPARWDYLIDSGESDDSGD